MKHFVKLMAIALIVLFCVPSCTPDQSEWPDSKNWAWMYVDRDFAESDWDMQLETMKQSGIDGVLLLYRGEDNFEQIARKIKKNGFELQAWIPVMNPHGADSLETLHPDWYQVSREGKSCLDHPPYIPSYKWLCPNNPEVKPFLLSFMEEMTNEEFLDGIHLDYIRFPDVILPIGIQPKYDLVQDHEFPEFDFCYCEHCRKKFEKETGIDPMDLDDPANSAAWVKFRYQSITDMVNAIAERVHKHNKVLSAAVFPTPNLARKLVRQDWPAWNLDEVMPMMYHQYYNAPESWIETASREGVEELQIGIPLYSGLFINEIKPGEFADVISYAKSGGAKGICLFNANGMSGSQWKALRKALQ